MSTYTGDKLITIPESRLTKIKVLGAGAFGEVYLATYDGQAMAVKANKVSCLDIHAIDKVSRGNMENITPAVSANWMYLVRTWLGRVQEKLILEKLLENPHPCIAKVFGMCTDAGDGFLRLVMQYCPGGGLDEFLKRNRVEVSVFIAFVSIAVPGLVLTARVRWRRGDGSSRASGD